MNIQLAIAVDIPHGDAFVFILVELLHAPLELRFTLCLGGSPEGEDEKEKNNICQPHVPNIEGPRSELGKRSMKRAWSNTAMDPPSGPSFLRLADAFIVTNRDGDGLWNAMKILVSALSITLVLSQALSAAENESFAKLFKLSNFETNGNWMEEKRNVLHLKPREGETGWKRYGAYLWFPNNIRICLPFDLKSGKAGTRGSISA